MNKKLLFPLAALLFSLTSCGGDTVKADTALEGLAAKGNDEGVLLSWKAEEKADSYLVYQDDKVIREVDKPYVTIPFLEENKSYHFGVAWKAGESVSPITYVDGKMDKSVSYDPFIDKLQTGLEKRIGEGGINKMFTAGNVNDSTTNTYAFKHVIDEMKAGNSKTIAYIGGSITVGEKATALDSKKHQKGYAYYSYRWMKEHYDKNQNSKFINASISGTDTSIATVRLEKDVLQYNPDLVFVEFAANNGTSIYDQKTYESLVRRILMQPNKPAVVLLFSATSYSKNHQDSYMMPIGKHYGLPMFSFVNALGQVCGNMKTDLSDPIFKFFTTDGVHPNDQGHQLYAKTLVHTLRNLINAESSATSYNVPETPWKAGYDCYTNLTYVNNSVNNSIITSTGSFAPADTLYRVLKDTADVEAFQKGWKKTSTTENNALTITVTCKNFFIIYLAANPQVKGDPKGNFVANYANQANASDKGELKWDAAVTGKQSSLTNVVNNGNGWENPCCMILIDNDASATYNISIKMENAADTGILLAFGYCD